MLWSVLGVALQLFGGWRHGGSDEGGGGTFAMVGLIGLVVFFVLAALVAWVHWLVTSRDR